MRRGPGGSGQAQVIKRDTTPETWMRMRLWQLRLLLAAWTTAAGGRDVLAPDVVKVADAIHIQRAPQAILEHVLQSSEAVSLGLVSPGEHQLVSNVGVRTFGPIVLREGTKVYNAPIAIGDAVLVLRVVGPENAFFEWNLAKGELEFPETPAISIDMATFPQGAWTVECACVPASLANPLSLSQIVPAPSRGECRYEIPRPDGETDVVATNSMRFRVGSASEELDVVASSSSVTLGETYSIFLSVAPTLGAPVGSAPMARLKLAAGVFSESCAQYCRFDVRMRQLGFHAFEAELLSASGSVAAVRSVHVFVFENATVWLGEPTSADDVTAADAEFLFRKCAARRRERRVLYGVCRMMHAVGMRRLTVGAVCVRVRVRACVRACLCVPVCACVCAHAHACAYVH